jgi:hypothetical protein
MLSWNQVALLIVPPLLLATTYPALFGQFRVELTGRGYQSSGAKRPHWYGLALRADGTHLE